MAHQEKNPKNIKLRSAGSVVRRIREERGWTVEELARKLKWNKSRLSRYENDVTPLSMDILERIASALEMSPVVLVGFYLNKHYPQLRRRNSAAWKAIEDLMKLFQES